MGILAGYECGTCSTRVGDHQVGPRRSESVGVGQPEGGTEGLTALGLRQRIAGLLPRGAPAEGERNIESQRQNTKEVGRIGGAVEFVGTSTAV